MCITNENSIFLLLLLLLLVHTKLSSSSLDTFIYGGCSTLKYNPSSPNSTYNNNLNSILTSLVNSATFTNYNNFTIQSLSGLYQCRGDLNPDDCGRCVSSSVVRLGTLCPGSTGGVIQLEGCLVKYDNSSFLGVQDKSVVSKKCGLAIGYNSDALTRRDALLGYLAAGDGSYKPYRTGRSGDIYGYAQCVGDLSGSKCQECLSEAVQQIKNDCGGSVVGDMYLAKCYIRYLGSGAHSRGGHDDDGVDEKKNDETEKTLAILIALTAGVTLLIFLVCYLRKSFEKGKGDK